MSLRGSLRKLERAYQGEMVSIPQKDGSVKHFPQSALKEAFLRTCALLRARANGDSPPEPHPLQLALQNTSVPEQWHATFYDMFEEVGEVEDLSEP